MQNLSPQVGHLAIKQSELTLAVQSISSMVLGNFQPSSTASSVNDLYDCALENFNLQTAVSYYGSVAVIPIIGKTVYKQPFAPFYGMADTAEIAKKLEIEADNAAISSIILEIHSPGGMVQGNDLLILAIESAKRKKPVWAYVPALAASAAYWVAAACDKIILGSGATEVGSIGVYYAHYDFSKLYENSGITITEFQTGEYKAVGSPLHKMSDGEKAIIQKDLDAHHTRFTNSIAANRKLELSKVLSVANGLTFSGQEAISLGLADSINTFKEVLSMTTQTTIAPTAPTTATTPDAQTLRIAELEAQIAKSTAEAAATKLAADTATCQQLYADIFTRGATATELSAYLGMPADSRELFASSLKTVKASAKLPTNLTTDLNLEGKSKPSGAVNPLTAAFKALSLVKS